MNRGPGFDDALSEALEAVAQTAGDTAWSEHLKATSAFYERIFEEAGHSIAWEIVQRLNGRISRLRALTITAKNRERSGLYHMTAIHDAVLSGDADAARNAVSAHLKDAAGIAEGFLSGES